MSSVLVTFQKDWADEFDVYGWYVDTKEKFEFEIASLKKYKKVGGFYFGTNEGWEPEEETGAEWARSFEAQDITDEEVEVLERLFGCSFGTFPDISELIGYADEMGWS